MTAMLERAAVRYSRSDWAEMADCRRRDLVLFFGTDKAPLAGRNATAGRAVCYTCPVRRDCLLDALATNEQNGLRGGFLPHERAQTMVRVGGAISAALADYDAGVFYQPPRRT